MKNKKGFIATSIIFSFFIVFLMLLTINLTNFLQNRIFMNQIKKDIKNSIGIKPNGPKCKRATTLHTVECTQIDSTYYCGGAGFTASGKFGHTLITFGQISESGLNSGDAFDCDVNGDGIYDSETERFYYISNYYNTKTKVFENDTVVLLYYNNTSNGKPSNTTSYKYNDYTSNFRPFTAINHLPKVDYWRNVSLKNNKRNILNEENGNIQFNSSSDVNLATDVDYSEYAARFLTIQELMTIFENNTYSQTGFLDNYSYLFENTKFVSNSYSRNYSITGYWLETARRSTTAAWTINSERRVINSVHSTDANTNAVRPVIEVPISEIKF